MHCCIVGGMVYHLKRVWRACPCWEENSIPNISPLSPPAEFLGNRILLKAQSVPHSGIGDVLSYLSQMTGNLGHSSVSLLFFLRNHIILDFKFELWLRLFTKSQKVRVIVSVLLEVTYGLSSRGIPPISVTGGGIVYPSESFWGYKVLIQESKI